ncbi:hypothetical protein [Saccharopolyspora sp. CA-218241]|uniref:hypothetical protein n=1 Tax=Saccharopolyspora sp. CA-218241 TaxID=3240027 RepID=UPI003D96FFDC
MPLRSLPIFAGGRITSPPERVPAGSQHPLRRVEQSVPVIATRRTRLLADLFSMIAWRSRLSCSIIALTGVARPDLLGGKAGTPWLS